MIEGVDGSGKTSIAKLLAEKIDGEYYHSPSRKIEFLHKLANASSPLFRYYYFLFGNYISSKEFKKILRKKQLVVDKYIYSTVAFHSEILGKKLELPKNLVTPDIIIYIKADWYLIDKRISERPNRSKYEEIEFLKAVEKEYNRILKPLSNIIQIDTTNKTAEQAVTEITLKILQKAPQ